MTQTTSATVAGYLDRLKWSYNVVDESTIVSGYRCPVNFYYYTVRLQIKVSEHWVYLRAILQREIAPAQQDAVLRLISELNQHSHNVRFLLVQGCVVAQAEIPVVQFHAGSFLDALEGLYRNSHLAGVEIAVLATNPSTSNLYLQVYRSRTAEQVLIGQPAVAEDDLPDFDLDVNVLKERAADN
jgi:hypothetical protein